MKGIYERILVPLDTSKLAEIPLPYVVEFAASLSSEIILLTVAEPNTLNIEHRHRSYLERIVKQVQSLLKDYGAKDKAKVQGVTIVGKSADEILRYADDNDVSLIAMSSRGSSGEGPWFLGSIAAKVLRATSKPVLLIRAPADSAALEQKRLVKKILVPLDGSRIGEIAIPHTEELAIALDAEVELFQVLEFPIVVSGRFVEDEFQANPEKMRKGRASGIAYLDDVGKTLKERGIKISSSVTAGSPAEEIMRCAEEESIDLIAMSTHGRSGIGRWAFGSVTDKVIHTGDTPVLLVHARGT
jgi:nucleotide-binding universal stress UspA family protein